MSGKTALPPVPPSLKQIASYIQRADELKTKDPVMSYWCMCSSSLGLYYRSSLDLSGTYYAAQMGLDLQVHEVAARNYLYTLISVLEEACSTFASVRNSQLTFGADEEGAQEQRCHRK